MHVTLDPIKYGGLPQHLLNLNKEGFKNHKLMHRIRVDLCIISYQGIVSEHNTLLEYYHLIVSFDSYKNT
jgi:hypothetical protein